jgi:hypothetical protein
MKFDKQAFLHIDRGTVVIPPAVPAGTKKRKIASSCLSESNHWLAKTGKVESLVNR